MSIVEFLAIRMLAAIAEGRPPEFILLEDESYAALCAELGYDPTPLPGAPSPVFLGIPIYNHSNCPGHLLGSTLPDPSMN